MKSHEQFEKWVEFGWNPLRSAQIQRGEAMWIWADRCKWPNLTWLSQIFDVGFWIFSLNNVIYLSLVLLYIEYLFGIIDVCPFRKHGLNCLCFTLILLKTIFVNINISFKFQWIIFELDILRFTLSAISLCVVHTFCSIWILKIFLE